MKGASQTNTSDGEAVRHIGMAHGKNGARSMLPRTKSEKTPLVSA